MKSISVFRIPDNKPDRRYQHKKAAYAVFSESDNPYFDFSMRLTPLQSQLPQEVLSPYRARPDCADHLPEYPLRLHAFYENSPAQPSKNGNQ